MLEMFKGTGTRDLTHFLFTNWIMGSAVYPDPSSSIFARYSFMLFFLRETPIKNTQHSETAKLDRAWEEYKLLSFSHWNLDTDANFFMILPLVKL